MYNLFIVRSPLQLLNAIEAQYHFKTQNNILCLIHNTSKVNSIQMYKILSLTTWDNTIELNQKNQKNSFIKNVNFIKNLRTKQYQYIFTGDLGNINIAFISSLNKKYTYLIDDGTMTLDLHKKKLNPNFKHKETINTLIKKYRYLIFGLKCKLQREEINYFTFFDILPYRKEKVIQNKFLFLKEKFLPNSYQDTNIVYLLGQNLVEVNAMLEVVYIQYIKKIIKYYGDNKKIIYYPHRSEKITNNYDILKNENFIIMETTQPIEIELLTNNIYPSCIVSFISSALFSLHKIFPNSDIHSFIIEPKSLLNFQETIRMLYKDQDKAIQQIHLEKV